MIPHYEGVRPHLPFENAGETKCERLSTRTYGSNSRVIHIEGLLSSIECDCIVQSARPHMAPVDWEYSKDYRSCMRAVMMSEELSTTLAERLRPLWERADLDGVQPFGWATDGVWLIPHRLPSVNPCMRVASYRPGERFAPHRDSGFVVTDDYRSIYTVLVFLNEDFEGGETAFFATKDNHEKLRMRKGSALVFNHDVRHEGCSVVSGVKHVLRTDILFQRAVPLTRTSSSLSDPLFREAHELYQRSIELQKQGDPKGSTEAFVRAVELHAQVHSVRSTREAQGVAFTTALSRDVWIHVGSFLPLASVVLMQQLNTFFRSVFRHPRLWSLLYHIRWPLQVSSQVRSFSSVHNVGDTDHLSNFWLTAYQYRHLADTRNDVLWVDAVSNISSTNLMSAAGSQGSLFSSRVGTVSGHLWSAAEGLCNSLAGQSLERNHLDNSYQEEVTQTDTLYFGSSESPSIDLGADGQVRWRLSCRYEWHPARDKNIERIMFEEKDPFFSPFVAGILVSHCYGRGRSEHKLCGSGDSRFAPLEHPVLIAVMPNAVKHSMKVYAWLSDLLPALPYYRIISVSDLLCHVYGLSECVCVAINDCGLCVSFVKHHKEERESILSWQFPSSLVSFPCPNVEEEQRATVGRIAVALESPEVSNFLQKSVEKVFKKHGCRHVMIGGLVDQACWEQVRTCLGSDYLLAPFPTNLDPLLLTGHAAVQFLSSPHCVAEQFVPSQFLLEQRENLTRTRLDIPSKHNDLSLREPKIHFKNIGSPAGFPRVRAIRWEEILPDPEVLNWARTKFNLSFEIPPGIGTFLGFVFGVNGPAISNVVLHFARNKENHALYPLLQALLVWRLLQLNCGRVACSSGDYSLSDWLRKILGKLHPIESSDIWSYSEKNPKPGSERVVRLSRSYYSNDADQLDPETPWGGLVLFYVDNTWQNWENPSIIAEMPPHVYNYVIVDDASHLVSLPADAVRIIV